MPFLSIAACAAERGVHYSTVYRAIVSGRLKAERPFGEWQIQAEEWVRFIERGRRRKAESRPRAKRFTAVTLGDFETARRQAMP